MFFIIMSKQCWITYKKLSYRSFYKYIDFHHCIVGYRGDDCIIDFCYFFKELMKIWKESKKVKGKRRYKNQYKKVKGKEYLENWY